MPKQNHHPSKILALLDCRERYGVVSPSSCGARGPAFVDYRLSRDVRVEDLSSAIAWYAMRRNIKRSHLLSLLTSLHGWKTDPRLTY